ncbi:MAG: protein kinase [Gemmatimonadetes bacterium]|nr:protein kinase [Gemmatimonadota bacterium]
MKKSLGHYAVIEKLGAGGMGEVYRVRDTILDRQVALKVLQVDLAADPLHMRLFNQEARAIAALDHPNIIRIYSVEEIDGVHFFTMELVEGLNLSEIPLKNGLGLDRFLDIGMSLVRGISYAHSRSVTHRDLKPSNIMVNEDDDVKIVDFGLAKLLKQSRADLIHGQDTNKQQRGPVVGTVAYMSPEQAMGRPTHPSSDVFSIGVIFYEMATGRSPFCGNTAVATMESVLTEDPLPVSHSRPDLPPELLRIIDKCLEKDPGLRYSSAGALNNDIEKFERSMRSIEAATRRARLRIDPSIRAGAANDGKRARRPAGSGGESSRYPQEGYWQEGYWQEGHSSARPASRHGLFEESNDPVFASDENNQIVFWNDAMQRLDGRTREEVLGKKCHHVVCGLDLCGNRYCREGCQVRKMAAGGETLLPFELTTANASGGELHVSVKCFVDGGGRAGQGRLFHILHTVRNETAVSDAKPARRENETTLSFGSEVAGVRDSHDSEMTRRQLEILRLLSRGTGTRRMADKLCITPATVRHDLDRILEKLDAHSRGEAVAVACQRGLI